MENFRVLEKEFKKKQFSKKSLQHSNKYGKGGGNRGSSGSDGSDDDSDYDNESDEGDSQDDNVSSEGLS